MQNGKWKKLLRGNQRAAHHRASVAVVQLGLGYERCSTAFSAVKWRQLLLPAFCLTPAPTLSLPSPITVVVIVALRIVSTS